MNHTQTTTLNGVKSYLRAFGEYYSPEGDNSKSKEKDDAKRAFLTSFAQDVSEATLKDVLEVLPEESIEYPSKKWGEGFNFCRSMTKKEIEKLTK